MRADLTKLTGVCLLLVAFLAVLAALVGGRTMILQVLTASSICIPLVIATYAVSLKALPMSFALQSTAILGGGAVRFLAAPAAGFAAYFLIPACHYPSFWIWLIAIYLLTLLTEVVLLTSRLQRAAHAATVSEN